MLSINKKSGMWSYHNSDSANFNGTVNGTGTGTGASADTESKLSKIYHSVMKNVKFKPKRIPYEKWLRDNKYDIEFIVDTLYDNINSFTYETANTDEFIYANIIGQKLREDLTIWLYNNSLNSLSKYDYNN